MLESALTLHDGTLVDFAHDVARGRLTVRAGQSPVPAERPVVLLLTPGDAHQVCLHLAGFFALTGVAAKAVGDGQG